MMLRLMTAAALIVAVPASAEKPKRDAAEKSADPRDKTICKRFAETGSLVRGYRTCKLKAEWDMERDNIRTQNSSGSTCNGPGCT